jgi:hypothetical protein
MAHDVECCYTKRCYESVVRLNVVAPFPCLFSGAAYTN